MCVLLGLVSSSARAEEEIESDGWNELESAIELAQKIIEDQDEYDKAKNFLHDVSIAEQHTLFSDTSFMFHKTEFRNLLKTIIDRVSFKDDPQYYELQFKGSPLPLSSIEKLNVTKTWKLQFGLNFLTQKTQIKNTKHPIISIAVGLMAFVKNVDELAAVIANRMSYDNQIVWVGKGGKKINDQIENVIRQLQGQHNLEGRHRDAIRADLSAVERLIKGGYNPWAIYNIQRRLASWISHSIKSASTQSILGRLFGREYIDLRDQPIPELRLEAMKLYIMNKGFNSDISDLVEHSSEFTPTLTLLKLRAHMISFPLVNRTIRSGIALSLIFAGFVSIIQLTSFGEKWIDALSPYLHIEKWLDVYSSHEELLKKISLYGSIAIGAPILAQFGYRIFKYREGYLHFLKLKSESILRYLAQSARALASAAKGAFFGITGILWDTLKFFFFYLPKNVPKITLKILEFLKLSFIVVTKGFATLASTIYNKAIVPTAVFFVEVFKTISEAAIDSGASIARFLSIIGNQIKKTINIYLSSQAPVNVRMLNAWDMLISSLGSIQTNDIHDLERLIFLNIERPYLYYSLKNIKKIMTPLSIEQRQMIFGALAEDFNLHPRPIFINSTARRLILELYEFAGGRVLEKDFFDPYFRSGYIVNPAIAFQFRKEPKENRNIDLFYETWRSVPPRGWRKPEAIHLFNEGNLENFKRMGPLMAAFVALERIDKVPPYQRYLALVRLKNSDNFYRDSFSLGKRTYKKILPALFESVFQKEHPENAIHQREIEPYLLETKKELDAKTKDFEIMVESYTENSKISSPTEIEEAALSRNRKTFAEYLVDVNDYIDPPISLKNILNLGNQFFHYLNPKNEDPIDWSDYATYLETNWSGLKFDWHFMNAAQKVKDPFAQLGLLAFSRTVNSDWSGLSTSKWEIKILRGKWNDKATKKLRKFISSRINSIEELKAFIEQELIPRQIDIENLTQDFYKLVFDHPEWLRTKADLDALLGSSYFWPKRGSLGLKQTPIEETLIKIVSEQSRKYPKYWSVEPSAAEALHRKIIEFQNKNKIYGDSFNERFKFWMALSSRGVTSVSDNLFERLYSEANLEQKKTLENEAVQGRIWDQPLKVAIVRTRVESSPDYKFLINTNPAKDTEDVIIQQRTQSLNYIIGNIRNELPEKGLGYVQLLEDISNEISSTPFESSLIHRAKYGGDNISDNAEDFGASAISEILREVLDWKKEKQWEFIQFLRGDIDPTPFIQKQFSIIGPERIRRIFQLLPIAARASIFDSFLSSPKGLLETCNPKSKAAQMIMDYMLSKGDQGAREIGKQILEAFLYSLQGGNENARSYVLSYLLSMLKSNEENSVGQTLRNILEIFGATGVKIGQILAATEVLAPKENEYLFELQDQAKIPSREFIYSELRDITQEKDLPFYVGRLLGAASLKFAVFAKDKKSEKQYVLKVLRQESVAHTKAEFKQLKRMADYLVINYGSKYGLLRAIINAAQEAVQRELKLDNEAKMAELVAETVYQNVSTSEVKVQVPKEFQMTSRLMASQFADGISFRALPKQIQPLTAKAILQIETQNLFRDLADGENLVFDPDRHAGNFRIQPVGENSISLWPIDFGQVLKISKANREQVFDLFALAQIVRKTGATRWAALKTLKIIGIDDTQVAAKIYTKLKKYFKPNDRMKEVAAYYNMLAILSDVGHTRDIAFFDFVRSIMQLSQYRKLLPPEVAQNLDPQVRLKNIVTQRAELMGLQLREEIKKTDPIKTFAFSLVSKFKTSSTPSKIQLQGFGSLTESNEIKDKCSEKIKKLGS